MIGNILNQETLDQDQKESLYEMQLRREKELEDKDEERRYSAIKKIILPTLQLHIQKVLKDKSIDQDKKQELLKLKKKSE